MAKVQASTVVALPIDLAFAVSQTQGAVRYRWDPFVRSQTLLNADAPGLGVRTRTVSRHGLHMVSEYTSFRAPGHVGMKMVSGPWFFRAFAGGWSFRALDDEHTEATWRYTFAIRPGWLKWVVEPIGVRVLQRDIDRRIAGYASGCSDEHVIAAARAIVSSATDGTGDDPAKRQPTHPN